MENLFIFGAGGFANEVILAINDINDKVPQWNILGIIDDNKALKGTVCNGFTVLGGADYLINYGSRAAVVITINKPSIRKKIVEELSNNTSLYFPNIVHPTSVFYNKTCTIGQGNIVFIYTIISYNISIGDFNIINSYTGLGHDVSLGNYNTFNPRVAISGWVKMGDMNEFGMGSGVVQNKKLGSDNFLGAYSLLVRNLGNGQRYFGVPATKMDF
jgi:sugar O-acyltransferase (sialic acid O-acetyltransferase NeuD family)